MLPSLAVLVGLNEAMFLQQLHYWTDGPSGKERDGYAWVYNTYEQWHEQFPFWSIPTIRRIVGALEKRGLVVSTSTYNDHATDRTKWYAIDYDALDALIDDLPDGSDHVIKVISPSDQPEHMDVLTSDSSSIGQRLTKDDVDISSHERKRPPLTPRELDAMDPIADRDAILRGRIEPEVPGHGSLETRTAWLDLQDEWRRRNRSR